MKKLIMLLVLAGFFMIGSHTVIAQDSIDPVESEEAIVQEEAPETESKSFHQVIKQKFIEGGPGFMGIVLLCLILGLALAIETIIYLN